MEDFNHPLIRSWDRSFQAPAILHCFLIFISAIAMMCAPLFSEQEFSGVLAAFFAASLVLTVMSAALCVLRLGSRVVALYASFIFLAWFLFMFLLTNGGSFIDSPSVIPLIVSFLSWGVAFPFAALSKIHILKVFIILFSAMFCVGFVLTLVAFFSGANISLISDFAFGIKYSYTGKAQPCVFGMDANTVSYVSLFLFFAIIYLIASIRNPLARASFFTMQALLAFCMALCKNNNTFIIFTIGLVLVSIIVMSHRKYSAGLMIFIAICLAAALTIIRMFVSYFYFFDGERSLPYLFFPHIISKASLVYCADETFIVGAIILAAICVMVIIKGVACLFNPNMQLSEKLLCVMPFVAILIGLFDGGIPYSNDIRNAFLNFLFALFCGFTYAGAGRSYVRLS